MGAFILLIEREKVWKNGNLGRHKMSMAIFIMTLPYNIIINLKRSL